MIQALLIDPFAKTVTYTKLPAVGTVQLKQMYALMGCTMVEAAYLAIDETLWLDEEGRLKDEQAFFKFNKSQTYCGRALVTNTDDDGEITDTELTPEDILKQIVWLGVFYR